MDTRGRKQVQPLTHSVFLGLSGAPDFTPDCSFPQGRCYLCSRNARLRSLPFRFATHTSALRQPASASHSVLRNAHHDHALAKQPAPYAWRARHALAAQLGPFGASRKSSKRVCIQGNTSLLTHVCPQEACRDGPGLKPYPTLVGGHAVTRASVRAWACWAVSPCVGRGGSCVLCCGACVRFAWQAGRGHRSFGGATWIRVAGASQIKQNCFLAKLHA